VQKNKVFIFIAVLHLGETGSLTKLNLSKGMTFTLQCEVYMYSKTSETAQFFSRNAYCLVTNKRICRIKEYCNRDQATTKDGQQCFNTCYPKKGTHTIAKPRTPPFN
jgi:hypothetical protein